ncbi:MAG TPA: hypothetical protein VN519_13270 [Bryobacteraceae bacterium]|nr:hypothetical protein [Bryobacteraceae bacterium]
MSILLLAGLLASTVTAIRVVFFSLRGEFRGARRTGLRWMACAAAYAVILGITAKAARHESVIQTETPYCDDDLCMTIESYTRSSEQAGSLYRFQVRLSSLANRGVRSTKGFSVYMTDERDRRFPMVPDHSTTPFDADIEPGKTAATSLTFRVPSDARNLAIAAAADHLQYASFVIGNGDLLHHPRLKLRLE